MFPKQRDIQMIYIWIVVRKLALNYIWFLTWLNGNVCFHPCFPDHFELVCMQRLIFDKPEDGVRKIVLATNMAETSITINDVVFVVDCGKAKETSYDALNNTPCLLPSWISKASARQVTPLWLAFFFNLAYGMIFQWH